MFSISLVKIGKINVIIVLVIVHLNDLINGLLRQMELFLYKIKKKIKVIKIKQIRNGSGLFSVLAFKLTMFKSLCRNLYLPRIPRDSIITKFYPGKNNVIIKIHTYGGTNTFQGFII